MGAAPLHSHDALGDHTIGTPTHPLAEAKPLAGAARRGAARTQPRDTHAIRAASSAAVSRSCSAAASVHTIGRACPCHLTLVAPTASVPGSGSHRGVACGGSSYDRPSYADVHRSPSVTSGVTYGMHEPRRMSLPRRPPGARPSSRWSASSSARAQAPPRPCAFIQSRKSFS